MRTFTSMLTVGKLVPALILTVAAVDIAGRFTAVERWSFRAWEPLSRYAPLTAPFEPRRSYRNETTYGELAAMGNVPEERRYRAESFTSDELGFRNRSARGPWQGLLLGDSFAVGAAVSDGETFADQISAASGARIYNAGGLGLDGPSIVSLADQIGLKRGIILFEYYELAGVVAPNVVASRRLRLSEIPLLASVLPLIRGLVYVSPLRIALTRIWRQALNDRVLPNVQGRTIARAKLINGDSMLFLHTDVDDETAAPVIDAAAWKRLSAYLSGRGLDLVVVLVPSKYSVYGELTHASRDLSRRRGRLAAVEDQLRSAKISVVNVGPALAKAAHDGIAVRSYVYWPDDTHWNRAGIAIAANVVAAALDPGWTGKVDR